MSANRELVEKFENEFVAGNLDVVRSILADDIVVHECKHVPYPGDHHGLDGFLKLAEAFGACWEFKSELGVEYLPAGDDKVLVVVHLDVESKHTGKPMHLQIFELHRIEDGKIAEITVHYFDTAEITEVTDGVVVLEGAPA